MEKLLLRKCGVGELHFLVRDAGVSEIVDALDLGEHIATSLDLELVAERSEDAAELCLVFQRKVHARAGKSKRRYAVVVDKRLLKVLRRVVVAAKIPSVVLGERLHMPSECPRHGRTVFARKLHQHDKAGVPLHQGGDLSSGRST